MVTTIWILKALMALLFAFTGFSKMLLPKAKLLEKGMQGLVELDDQKITVIGFLEILGAFGLILPTILNIYPLLSAIAAFSLSLTMIAAGWIHYKLKLSVIPNIAVFAICVLIGYWELIQL